MIGVKTLPERTVNRQKDSIQTPALGCQALMGVLLSVFGSLCFSDWPTAEACGSASRSLTSTHLCHRARRPQAVSLVRGKCMFEKRGRKGEVTCSLEHCVRKVLDCGVLLFLVGLFFCLFFVCNLDGHVLEF